MPLAMRLVCADTQLEIERLARAVQSVRDLDHRAVLRPLQMVRSSTRLGVITQHIEGLTLAQLLAHGNAAGVSVPPALTLRIMADVIEGLDALRAHASATRRQDWLFGGLTPDNILVGCDGQSRVIDPGLAGAAARQPAFAHEPSALAYTAPELTGPEPQFTPACDVFSIGVMLWELLTGEPLFAAATAAQTLENLHRAPIERVQRHQFVRGEPIAFALAQAVANALKRNPVQRLPDYDALMTALVQAGPIGRPEAVAELVRHSTHKDSIAELKERIARMKQEEASSTSPRITLPVSANKKTQTGLGPITLAPPGHEPRASSTIPPQHDLITPAMPSSTHPTARMRRLPHPAQGPISITRISSAAQAPPETGPSLGADFEDQISAFPVGDLRRRSSLHGSKPAQRSRWLPILLAAVVLLAIGTYTLGHLSFDPEGAARPTAAGRVPPNAAVPQVEAPPESPIAAPGPPPTAPAVAAPQVPAVGSSAQSPAEEPAAVPQAQTLPQSQAVREVPEKEAPDAATTDKRRVRSSRRGDVELKPAKPASETPRAPTRPAEPPPVPREGVLKITPAPEPAPSAPARSAIPEDI